MISNVIKKDHRIVGFNRAKLRMSIERAFIDSGNHYTGDYLDDLLDKVIRLLESTVNKTGTTEATSVHSDDIRGAVKLVLVKEHWDEVIYAYCGYFRPKIDSSLVEVVSTIYRLGREGKTEVLSVLSTLIDAAIKDVKPAQPQLADSRSDSQVTETADQERPITNKEMNDWLKAKPGRILRVIFPDKLNLSGDQSSWDIADTQPEAPVAEYACSYNGGIKNYALLYVIDEPNGIPVQLTREAISAGK